tara:strand:+ start:2927 stop:3070 length:144 start_codon:yes stop_codon:yes gene_type:complete
MKKDKTKKFEKWLESNDKKIEKHLIKLGFDPEWVKKSQKKVKKNRSK